MNLLGYCMKDILRLRLMMLAAASCLAAYFYSRPDPLMTVVYWNLFFVSLNAFQIARIIWERYASDTAWWRRGGRSVGSAGAPDQIS